MAGVTFLLETHWQNHVTAPDFKPNPSRLESAMQENLSRPLSGRVRRLYRKVGKQPDTWLKLAYTRSYTFKYGMRAAKLTAAIDCIKALRQEEPLRLP